VAGIAAVIVTVVVPGRNANSTGFSPTGSSAGQDAEQITSAFLQAWQTGDLGQAARYTDHPSAAQAALGTYGKYLHLRKLTTATQSATAISANTSSTTRESVGYAINAMVAASASAKALHGTWSYHSSLVAYQKQNSQLWYIAWTPDVLAPSLTASTHLAAVTVAPQVASVNDASGNDLTSYRDAGLTTIAGLLQNKAPLGQGTPGLYVEIQTASNHLVPNSQAVVIPPNNIPNLATTINAQAEAAARAAVAARKNSSMVVIQPSTGKILAIANNDGYNDFALTAKVAPGSTMKVISSTALINAGVLSASSAVACPEAYTVQGITYHNDNNETLPASTPFITDFAQSCNNAFSTQWPHLSGLLARTARKYFGLNQKWNCRPVGQLLQRPGRCQRLRTGSGGVRRGAADGIPAGDGVGGGHRGQRDVQAADPAGRSQAGYRDRASGQHRRTAEADDASRGHQRNSRVGRVRIGRLRQDRDRRHPGPGAAQQLAHRLRPGPGRRGRLPGCQRRLRRSVRRP
jgi:Penicillin binding protein transpeptidase domain/NTF2-like N-terminal transpeptidase domain